MMLKREIKILDDNRDAIVAALRDVNGRAQSHAVTTLAEVRRIAEMATRMLDRREVRVADRKGAVVKYVPAGPSAKAYKYSVASTLVVLRLASDGKTWRLAGAAAVQVSPKKQADLDITLTRAGHAGYMDARYGDFGIYRTPDEVEADRRATLIADTERHLRLEAAAVEAALARQEQADMGDLARFVA